MKSIITTYPEFTTLPRGIKRLLLASESYFFDEASTPLTPSATVSFSVSHRLLQNQESRFGTRRSVSIN